MQENFSMDNLFNRARVKLIYKSSDYTDIPTIDDKLLCDFFQALRVNWEQLLTAIARNINEVENQVKM